MEILAQFTDTLITAIIAGIVALIVSSPKRVANKRKEEQKKLEHMESGLVAILRSNITEQYTELMQDRYITQEQKANVAYLYQAYKDLGGNSYVHELVMQIMDLPIASKGKERDNEIKRQVNLDLGDKNNLR